MWFSFRKSPAADALPSISESFLDKHGLGVNEEDTLWYKNTPHEELIHRYFSLFQVQEMKRTGWMPVRGSNKSIYYVNFFEFGSTTWRVDGKRKFKHRCLMVVDVDRLDAAIARALLIQADANLFESKAL